MNDKFSQRWQICDTANPETVVVIPQFSRMDLTTCEEAEAVLRPLLNQGKKYLLLDLSRVSMMDSCIMGTLVEIYRALSGRGALGLCHVNPNILRVLSLTRLNEVFRVYENREAGLEDLA